LENAGVQSASDLSIIAPAVHVSTGLGGASIAIRGVGGTGSGADEPANAVYIDGVYQSSPTASLFAFNNIERIEVLKGPQGTLFGRNAAGGLVQIITRAPQFTPDAEVEVGYGNYDTVNTSVYVTGPLTDNVAIDFAGNFQDQGQGWGHNLATGKDAYSGSYSGARSKLLWNVDADTSVTLTGLYSRTFSPSLQGGGLLPGEQTVTGLSQGGFFDINHNEQERIGTEQQNYALTIKHAFGWTNFTSITSHDNVRFGVATDLDMSPIPLLGLNIDSRAKSWTQEFQLASPKGSPITWAAGFFYFNNDLVTDPVRASGLALAPLAYADTDSDATTDSYAVYGQATFPLTAKTHFTAGLRYTIDKREIGFTTSTSDPTIPTTVYPRQSVENSKPTWRFALDQNLTSDTLLYGSYSRGFKSGLFNATNPDLPPVQPETVDAYEIGLKSELWDHRLRANISGFYNSIDGIQLRGIPAGLDTPIFYNAASAYIKGVDFELQARPVDRLNIQVNATYLDGHYGSGFTNALFYSIPAVAGGLTAGIGDASHNKTILSPPFVASVSAQYRLSTPVGDAQLAGSYSFNDSFYFDPQNRVQQPAYQLLNASVTLTPFQHITLRIWANNITDRHYYSDVEPSNFGDEYYPAAPRTFGGTVKWSFQ
jgi:iron complex outermembrane receptor protein